jgi:t-SNARE complex subunit (syntaxin)
MLEIRRLETICEDELELKYDQEKLNKLQNDVNEITGLFETVNQLVNEQNTGLNIIEETVDRIEDNIQIGASELAKSSALKNDSDTKIFGLCLVAITIPISLAGGPIIGFSVALTGITGIGIYSKFRRVSSH